MNKTASRKQQYAEAAQQRAKNLWVEKNAQATKILFEGAYVSAPIWKTIASALITQWQIAP